MGIVVFGAVFVDIKGFRMISIYPREEMLDM